MLLGTNHVDALGAEAAALPDPLSSTERLRAVFPRTHANSLATVRVRERENGRGRRLDAPRLACSALASTALASLGWSKIKHKGTSIRGAFLGPPGVSPATCLRPTSAAPFKVRRGAALCKSLLLPPSRCVSADPALDQLSSRFDAGITGALGAQSPRVESAPSASVSALPTESPSRASLRLPTPEG